MWGHTQAATIDAALDTISTLSRDKDDALDALAEFMIAHPEHDRDPALTRARVALQ